MIPVRPDTGAAETVVAKDQPDYIAFPAALYATPEGHTIILSRWRFSAEEIDKILSGEDLYIEIMTFGQPVQPLLMQIGPQGYLTGTVAKLLCPKCVQATFDDVDAWRAHFAQCDNPIDQTFRPRTPPE